MLPPKDLRRLIVRQNPTYGGLGGTPPRVGGYCEGAGSTRWRGPLI